MIIGMALHVLAAVVWVGGMFFAHMVLQAERRPDSNPPVRLWLWGRVFPRFFLLGLAQRREPSRQRLRHGVVRLGGLCGGPRLGRAMTALGVVMSGDLRLHLFLAVAALSPRGCGRRLAGRGGEPQRRSGCCVTINLTLGLVTSAIGASGRYLG